MMTHIICRASTCLFWEDGVCGSEEIEYEPDAGCLTFEDVGDVELADPEDDEFDWEDSDDSLFEDEDSEEGWDEEEDGWDEDWEDDRL
jgi:hypothetical protein